MEIITIRKFKDGGSIEIRSADRNFFIDNRIGTKNKGILFEKITAKFDPLLKDDIETDIKTKVEVLEALRVLISSGNNKNAWFGNASIEAHDYIIEDIKRKLTKFNILDFDN